MSACFFFSYAHLDRSASLGLPCATGAQVNYVDELFDHLSRRVGILLAKPWTEVGFKDRKHLSIGDRWSNDIPHRLNEVSVLIALVTPSYLADHNGSCGKEVQAILDRLELTNDNENQNNPFPIVPIFWEDRYSCWKRAREAAIEFFDRIQFTDPGLPEDYPDVIGLNQIRQTRPSEYESCIFAIASRIVGLAERTPPLPRLPAVADFEMLQSAFGDVEPIAEEEVRNRTYRLAEVEPAREASASAELPVLSSPTGVSP